MPPGLALLKLLFKILNFNLKIARFVDGCQPAPNLSIKKNSVAIKWLWESVNFSQKGLV